MKQSSKEPAHILHVTESMAAGVLTLLASLSRRQVEAGATVTVWYMRRDDSPSPEEIRSRFLPQVTLREFSSKEPRFKEYINLFLQLQQTLKKRTHNVMHLHSSKAGIIGRAALAANRSPMKVFYSPHGFAFLRMDVPSYIRQIMLLAESLLSHVGNGLILTCESELMLARKKVRARRVFLMRTGVDPKMVGRVGRIETARQKPTVIMVGRISYQKAPWLFASIARSLGHVADFVWVGSGPEADEKKWLADAPVTVTGWLLPADLQKLINNADIMLFPSLWEGMPLSLIQAQAQGIPAVVSDIVGNRDAVRDGVTGYIRSDCAGLLEATAELIRNPGRRAEMSKAALSWAEASLTDENLGDDTLRIYNTDRAVV